MEKTEIILEQVVREPLLQKAVAFETAAIHKVVKKKDILTFGLFCVIGFFWSKGELLQLLHPMGMAYVSLFFGEGILFWGVLVAVGVGSLIGSPLQVGASLATACAIQLTLGRFVEREDFIKKGLLGGFACLLAGVFYTISQGGLTVYFVLTVVETGFVVLISLLGQKGAMFLLEKNRAPVPSREETLGMMLLLGGLLVGLATAQTPILHQWVLPFLAAYFIAIAAWCEGTLGGGASAGVLIGFLLYMSGGVNLIFFTLLGFSGFIASCAKSLGRLPLAIALAASPAIFLFYAMPDAMNFMWLGGFTAGAVAFVLTPKKYLAMLTGEFWVKEKGKDRYTRKQEMLEERLMDFSHAFTALANTFVKEEEVLEKKDISRLVDSIAEEVCQGCGLAYYCWQEELYHTYSMTFSALSYCEAKGRATLGQMPDSFVELCARGQPFMDTVNRVYENYRRDRIWFGRLSECRELVSQQMAAVSDILSGLSGQLEVGCVFLEQTGELLKEECAKAGIRLKEVRVFEEKNGTGRQVQVTLRGCGGRGVCKETLLPLVKGVVNRPMVFSNATKCQCGKDGICKLHFSEIPIYSLATATAFLPATEGAPSGDAAASLETEKGIALMALSDGMGQGREASTESRTAIELLEQFTEAGFERELAVKMINSALLLRRGEESYATLDICAVDLFDGRAEFIKLGAVSSYISRGGRILSVTAHSLPAGILKQVQVVKNEMLLKDGDMVFLLTDGVTDALGGDGKTALWLKEKLEQFPLSNPQDAAEYILQEAKKARVDMAGDDMTVMAGRFWKKRKGA